MADLQRLAIRAAGRGDPPFVFVHGFGCGLEDWDRQFSALAGLHRCVALDLPGHGGSTCREAPTMAVFVDAVFRAMDRSRVDRAILVGHSFGSKIIRACRSADPHRIRGLVLVDGSLYEGDHREVADRTKKRIAEVGFAAYVRSLFAPMIPDKGSAELRERLIERACRVDPAFGETLLLNSVRWDADEGRTSIKAIDVPCLVVQTTGLDAEKRRISLAHGMTTPFMRLVQEAVPGAELVVLPDIGHFPMLEAADVFNARLLAFAGTVRRAA